MMKFKLNQMIHPYQPDQILRVETVSNYSKIYFNKLPYALVFSVKLIRMELQLPSATFLRVYRRLLIHTSYVKQITGCQHKVIEFITGACIAVSRCKKKAVKQESFCITPKPDFTLPHEATV